MYKKSTFRDGDGPMVRRLDKGAENRSRAEAALALAHKLPPTTGRRIRVGAKSRN